MSTKKSSKSKKAKGTKEWAEKNVNIAYGCIHDCKYCYAKMMAIRFKRDTAKGWKKMKHKDESRFGIPSKRVKKKVMFPSTHDITVCFPPKTGQ